MGLQLRLWQIERGDEGVSNLLGVWFRLPEDIWHQKFFRLEVSSALKVRNAHKRPAGLRLESV